MLKTNYEGTVSYRAWAQHVNIVIDPSYNYDGFNGSRQNAGLIRVQLQPKQLKSPGLKIQIVDEVSSKPQNMSGNVTVNGVQIGHWGTTESGIITFYVTQAKFGDIILVKTNGNHLYSNKTYQLQLTQNDNVLKLERNSSAKFTITACGLTRQWPWMICHPIKSGQVIIRYKINGKTQQQSQANDGKVMVPISSGFWVGDTVTADVTAVGYNDGAAQTVLSCCKAPVMDVFLKKIE